MRTPTTQSRGPRLAGTRPGFTLIEVLVSLVILTVALLAIAQVFAYSARASTTGFQQTAAHIQALDMGERMWLDLTDPLKQIDAWKADHESSLPGWEGEVIQDPYNENDDELFQVLVRWSNSANRGNTTYEYHLRIVQAAGAP